MTNVFSSQHILTDTQSTTQEAAFRFIAENAYHLGVVSSVDGFAAGLKAREEHDSTGFMGGIAVPHCKSEHVILPAIFVVRFAHPIAWETMDDEPVSAVVSLAIPAEGAQESLVMLTKVSRAMMKPDIRNTLQTGDTETVVDTIHHLIA